MPDIGSPSLQFPSLFSSSNNPTAATTTATTTATTSGVIDLSSDEDDQLFDLTGCGYIASPAISFGNDRMRLGDGGPSRTSPPVAEPGLLPDFEYPPIADIDWTDIVEIAPEIAGSGSSNNNSSSNADSGKFGDDIFASASSSAAAPSASSSATSAASAKAAILNPTGSGALRDGWAPQSAWSSRLSELPGAVKNYAQYVTNDPTKTLEEIKSLLENIRPDMDIPPESREGTPDALVYPLMEHQKVGLTWMKKMEESKTRGGILADDVRFIFFFSFLYIQKKRAATTTSGSSPPH